MSRQRIDEMKKFIQLAEGTWSLPQTEQDYRKLAELLFGHGPKIGPDEMQDKIYHLYGDDQLFNMLDDLSALGRRDGDVGDVRSNVIWWIKTHDPVTYKNLYSIGKAQTFEGRMSEDFRNTTINPKHMVAHNKEMALRDREATRLSQRVAAKDERAKRNAIIGQMMIDTISSVVPDGDPMDWLLPKLRKLGISEYEAMDHLDRAARSLRYGSYQDLVDDMMDYYHSQNPALHEGLGDKISGWFFKKGTEPLIAQIDQLGPMSVASMIMQKPEKTQRMIIQGAKHYLNNVRDHAGLRKFVDVMSAGRDDIVEGVSLQKIAREVLRESEYGVGLDEAISEDVEAFFVIIGDSHSDLAVGMLDKEGTNHWHETTVYGNGPSSFGGKRYMGYLSPEDIISWLNRDYSIVIGPYEDEHEATTELDRMQEEADEDGDDYVYEKKDPKKYVSFSRKDTEEVEEAEINRIIDVGDAEDYEDEEPFDPDHLGIHIDLDEY